MHGVILYELNGFATRRVGPDRWREVLRAQGLENDVFTPLETQPDERVMALVAALAREAGVPQADVLREFGSWLAPHLLALYAPLIMPSWGPAEILQHVETVIHRAVRLRDPAATPPSLVTRRLGPDEVEIVYTSPRRLCALATGLIQGIATCHGRRADIDQPTCMHRGDAACLLSVRLT